MNETNMQLSWQNLQAATRFDGRLSAADAGKQSSRDNPFTLDGETPFRNANSFPAKSAWLAANSLVYTCHTPILIFEH
jgi:hypothetical protein